MPASYFGGWTDTVLMRLTDIQMALPFIVLAVAILSVAQPGYLSARWRSAPPRTRPCRRWADCASSPVTTRSRSPPLPSPEPMLCVRDLAVALPSRQGVRGVIHAVAGVSFDIEEGQSFGIVGESGAGRSVLLRTLAGLYRPSAGGFAFGAPRSGLHGDAG